MRYVKLEIIDVSVNEIVCKRDEWSFGTGVSCCTADCVLFF
jgi:hypothetical protein